MDCGWLTHGVLSQHAAQKQVRPLNYFMISLASTAQLSCVYCQAESGSSGISCIYTYFYVNYNR